MRKQKSAKQVGVRELKNSLSAYLREVKEGTTLVVTDHDIAIAELRPITQSINPVLALWIGQGVANAAQRPKSPLSRSPLSLPAGTALSLLDLDRGE